MSGKHAWRVVLIFAAGLAAMAARAADVPNVYADVVDRVPFDEVKQRMEGNKDKIVAAHRKLLEERYDLSDHPSATVKM
ncbi:MAG TPA: hypothetical protein VGO53_00150, partial [Steroidobacteraceae bacterium]|nr:hypothetical protein [Steroidobacteraceae bacterium]